MSVTVREVDRLADRALFDAIIDLRTRVWATLVSFSVTTDELIDQHDQHARHWVALSDNRVVGAARLTVHDSLHDVPEAECLAGVYSSPPTSPIGFMSRLVVDPNHRRHGIGRELDAVRIMAANAAGCRSILALVFEVSGQSRVNHLSAQGFVVRGRGQLDMHPKWSTLSTPLVMERVA